MADSSHGGLALVIGMLIAIVTMAVHPTHVDGRASAESLASAMRVLVAVHGLGLLSIPVLVFGFVGLSVHLGIGRSDALLALVVYALSAVALMFAAIADGLLNAVLIPPAVDAQAEGHALAQAILRYNVDVNQACAQVYVAGSSIALLLWSMALARSPRGQRRLAAIGGLVGVAALAGLLSGHVRMSAHGFGAIVLLQACWIVATGVWLMRRRDAMSRYS